MANVVPQPETTPEREEELVHAQNGKPIAPLSEALKDLLVDILDQTFDASFFQKIKAAEDAKFTGEYLDHWKNGQLKIKATLKEGKVDGHVHGWFPDGFEAFKAFFYENMKVGIHMVFYPKKSPEPELEKIARIYTFDFKGKLDNRQTSEFQNGKLKSMVRFKHGLLHGHLSMYNGERVCIKECDYEEGKLVVNKSKKR